MNVPPALSPPPPSAEELGAALADARVARALYLALRDVQLRARFEALRSEGRTVDEAVEQLLGPHLDADGQPYYLSEERVRGIVYGK